MTEDQSPKKLREEVEDFVRKIWLGDKLAVTVSTLLIDSFDEDVRPVKLATATSTFKLLQYVIKQETAEMEVN
ncbi:MAG: hypothetical protein HY512_01120 [Candidatus Aenigmarchaeota archaeon]|nr:hypothetical protein [Candidatus Aenigmarchaeota archaeon]